ncbi:MAG: GIY-YIG nuclease family protein [Anaerolineae bacterium]
MRLPRRITLDVGQLGPFEFPSGWYAYAGSARGPGGLAARVCRHCRGSDTHHWHVDYLRAQAVPAAVWYACGTEKRECDWALVLCQSPGASLPAPRFGASDCQCPAHAVHFQMPPDHASFSRSVEGSVAEELLDA